MFELPVSNGKNRPTTLASQFGGSGKLFVLIAMNVVSLLDSVYDACWKGNCCNWHKK